MPPPLVAEREQDDPDPDPVSGRILLVGSALLCVTGSALALLLAADLPQTLPRVLINGLIGMAGALALYLVRAGRRQLAGGVLIGMYWLGVTAITTINGGLKGPNLVNYPLILVIAGWMLGARQTVVFAVLTEGVFVALLVGDAYGWIQPPGPGSPLAHFVLLTAVTLMTAAATLMARRGYLRRLAQARRAAAEIAAQQAELQSAQAHLETLVEERTRELAAAKSAAEAASVAKSAFLANMSHEIRTPLNAITGMAHLMRRSGLALEQGQRLDKLEAASRQLLAIVDAVLDLSKIEAGKLSLVEEPVYLHEVVGNAVAMVGERAQAKGLLLSTEVPPDPVPLLGDATRLQQALLNYLANAVKFTAQGQIVLKAIVQEEDEAGALLRFEVVDSGPGIAPEVLPRLFAAFEQADNSTSRQHGGTGLGLAITRRLARLMGGEAGVHSVPGQGSRFWFTARLKKPPAGAAPADPAAQESGVRGTPQVHGGRRVLLVEDDPINREVASALLQAMGLNVDTAENGLQAVAMARLGGYALILMDLQMPELDGIEATKQIRAQAGNADRPILAMTANAFAEDRARCRAAGMNDFIAKPIAPAQLKVCLQRWLQPTGPPP